MPNSAQLSDHFRKRLKAFRRELAAIEKGNLEALHRTRIASRRLRELLPLLALGQKGTRKIRRQLRRVTNQLGAVRELDALALQIREFERSRRHPLPPLHELSTSVARARAAARERLSAKLPTSKLEKMAHRLQRLARQAESRAEKSARPKRTWIWALQARLVRRARRAHIAIQRAGAFYVPKYLHDVRVAIKKLRYAAELLEPPRSRSNEDLAVLKSAQDVLGHLHDLETLSGWASEAQNALSPRDVQMRRDLTTLIEAIERDCRELHARYVGQREGLLAITRRLAGAAAFRATSAPRKIAV